MDPEKLQIDFEARLQEETELAKRHEQELAEARHERELKDRFCAETADAVMPELWERQKICNQEARSIWLAWTESVSAKAVGDTIRMSEWWPTHKPINGPVSKWVSDWAKARMPDGANLNAVLVNVMQIAESKERRGPVPGSRDTRDVVEEFVIAPMVPVKLVAGKPGEKNNFIFASVMPKLPTRTAAASVHGLPLDFDSFMSLAHEDATEEIWNTTTEMDVAVNFFSFVSKIAGGGLSTSNWEAGWPQGDSVSNRWRRVSGSRTDGEVFSLARIQAQRQQLGRELFSIINRRTLEDAFKNDLHQGQSKVEIEQIANEWLARLQDQASSAAQTRELIKAGQEIMSKVDPTN